MNWYLKCFKQYDDFNGRARRKEYWMFWLFNGIFGSVIEVVGLILGLAVGGDSLGTMMGLGAIIIGVIMHGLYVLITFLPMLSVMVRRLHDVGRSGWMILAGLIPLVGAIWLFVLTVMDSHVGDNQYGPNPKKQ